MTEYTLWQWPSLQRATRGKLPKKLASQRGVFGKVHGARSDFRWIAKSTEFSGDDLKIYLGGEDNLCTLSFWYGRQLKDKAAAVYFAGASYPSRVQDAAGRSGSLETQIAESGGSGLPAALVALLLLPRVRQWDDKVWWDRREEKNWLLPGSVLAIKAEACNFSLPDDLEGHLNEVIAKGRASLAVLGADEAGVINNLANFYAALLAGEKPAVLYAASPLTAEALAVLLLPLPPALADSLSLAGWIPSLQIKLAELGKYWDGVVLPKEGQTTALSATAAARLTDAEKMARALLENRPSLLIATEPEEEPSLNTTPQENARQSTKTLQVVVIEDGQSLPASEPDKLNVTTENNNNVCYQKKTFTGNCKKAIEIIEKFCDYNIPNVRWTLKENEIRTIIECRHNTGEEIEVTKQIEDIMSAQIKNWKGDKEQRNAKKIHLVALMDYLKNLKEIELHNENNFYERIYKRIEIIGDSALNPEIN
ncbi:hypothetical protein [Methylovulum psychrotolerans]|uniref:Uncharacterized protein n=1 Tax=Methylovulum psychrotolerans TaxID=1704499 RepID=A0A1Z4C2B0_9GAMM|nr:hypothetical protein [Methylovulum psychrotolerans]ASF47645.1 hypothetical protein CEK71_17110 [Methylovulum psychrotolerans]